MIKAWKIKHLPTGLFFCPSRRISIRFRDGSEMYVKSNLSKTGKTYIKQPTLKHLSAGIYNHLKEGDWNYLTFRHQYIFEEFKEEDWEIVSV